MKKAVFFSLFTLVTSLTFAQVSWNAKMGLNISNWIGEGDSDARAGFRIGVGMEYAFTDMWLLQPSLYYSTKGAKNINKFEVADYVSGDATASQLYLELPVMGAARFVISDNTNLVISAGPYFAYGMGGKIKGEQYTGGMRQTSSVDTFGGDRLRRFDTGVSIGFAAELSRLILALEGQIGVLKVMDHCDARNLNCSVLVGVKF